MMFEISWPWTCPKCGHNGLDPDPQRSGRFRGWCTECSQSYDQELVNRRAEWTIQLDEEAERAEREGKGIDEQLARDELDRARNLGRLFPGFWDDEGMTEANLEFVDERPLDPELLDKVLNPARCPLHDCPMIFVRDHAREGLEEWYCQTCATGETQGGPWWE